MPLPDAKETDPIDAARRWEAELDAVCQVLPLPCIRKQAQGKHAAQMLRRQSTVPPILARTPFPGSRALRRIKLPHYPAVAIPPERLRICEGGEAGVRTGGKGAGGCGRSAMAPRPLAPRLLGAGLRPSTQSCHFMTINVSSPCVDCAFTASWGHELLAASTAHLQGRESPSGTADCSAFVALQFVIDAGDALQQGHDDLLFFVQEVSRHIHRLAFPCALHGKQRGQSAIRKGCSPLPSILC